MSKHDTCVRCGGALGSGVALCDDCARPHGCSILLGLAFALPLWALAFLAAVLIEAWRRGWV